MKYVSRNIWIFFIALAITLTNIYANEDLNNKKISVKKDSFKVLKFNKTISNVKVSNKDLVEVEFVKNSKKPLQIIRVFTKSLGNANIFILFEDNTSKSININITQDLETIIDVAKVLSPSLKVKQINKKVILSGKIKNQKQKDKILNLFKKADVDLKKDLVDLTSLNNPDKMIRLKLYVVEMNNNKGLELKNEWDYEFERNSVQSSSLIQNAVTLTGGLNIVARYLGNNFNAGLVLNYLASNGAANIIDETTLLTLENQAANFLAGGTFNIRTQTTTAEGLPSTELQEIQYGLQLNIKAENIINENFVKLNIETKSSTPIFTEAVDGIPNISEKSIMTNVVAANKSTIVLGGLVKTEESTDIDKVPFLGDIPILGYLFTNKNQSTDERSELVFFITPEIVDPTINNQQELFNKKTVFKDKIKKKLEPKQQRKEKKDTIQQDKSSLHQQRVNEILGM
ncbi:MAG: hypothetical protein ACQERD_01945 [Campylobacterota bacterium]